MDTFKITGTRKVQSTSPSGTPVEYYAVDIQTARGSTGTTEVPLTKWNADDLKALLEEFAESLDLAFTLTE